LLILVVVIFCHKMIGRLILTITDRYSWGSARK